MQELKCFGGGACFAISQEGLEWLCKRKCTDEEITKRDASVRLWISKKHMVAGEGELLSFCCLHECESSWTRGTTQSTVCPVPALDFCRNQRAFTPLPSMNSTFAERCPWIDFPHTPDNLNHLTKNLNCNPKERVVILYNDDILAKIISDAIYCRDDWSMEIPGPLLNTNTEDPNRPGISRNKNNYDRSQSDVINKNYSDSHFCDAEMEKKSGIRIRRKSVSFADDVIVYLYDKDSPAGKLHPQTDIPTSSSSNLSEILFDDNGLEWEDDFLALEKNCHPHNHPESCPFTFSLPTQNWTIPEPKSLFLSQNCLFLTHVNESDLEP